MQTLRPQLAILAAFAVALAVAGPGPGQAAGEGDLERAIGPSELIIVPGVLSARLGSSCPPPAVLACRPALRLRAHVPPPLSGPQIHRVALGPALLEIELGS